MTGQVYFASSAGRIKVGTTLNVPARIKQISGYLADPIVLLGCMPGGISLERAIQKHLEPFKLKGEWFQECMETSLVVKELLRLGPNAIGFDGDVFAKKTVWPKANLTPSRKLSLRELVTFIWPQNPAENLSRFSGEPIEVCQQWLDETLEYPRLLRSALAHVIFVLMYGTPEQLEELMR